MENVCSFDKITYDLIPTLEFLADEPTQDSWYLSHRQTVKDQTILHTGLLISVHNQKLISYMSTKTYVEGTQNNGLDETVLLSTKNKC